MLVATTNNIQNSKMRAYWIVAVLDVVVTWQDERNGTFLQEINAVDLVTILVYIFVFLDANWFQHGTDEGDERPRLVMQEPYLLVCLLVDEEGHFDLEALRKYIHELC